MTIFNPDEPHARDRASEQLYNQLVAFCDPDRYESPIWIDNRQALAFLTSALHAERFDPEPPEPHNQVLARIGICHCPACEASTDKWKGTA